MRRRGVSAPVHCSTAGCGDLARPGRGCLFCANCDSARLAQHAISGPTDEGELDVTLFWRAARGGACGHADCGQPTMHGRLYCSDRCRSRARSAVGVQAQIEIDGVVASMRVHAANRQIDIRTVWSRLRAGLTPVEAITREVCAAKRPGSRTNRASAT